VARQNEPADGGKNANDKQDRAGAAGLPKMPEFHGVQGKEIIAACDFWL